MTHEHRGKLLLEALAFLDEGAAAYRHRDLHDAETAANLALSLSMIVLASAVEEWVSTTAPPSKKSVEDT